ncbi:hypothetical protein ANN_09043 [Periplaneta americana]|uniref:Reverse transcriptase domain-containing protein n=1 Tax=Periplaneta americana TaxID=6978 RepID=A0ABQ8TKB0_PERAM|nr:hypothetical protein ANN_09043 [Periplaneta americana]
MAGLCEGGNEPPGSLKAICHGLGQTCRTVAPQSDCFTPLSYPTHLFYQCGHDVLVTLGCINIHSRGGRKGKGTRNAIGQLWTIGERFLEKNKEVYVGFVDLENAFDRVDWNKLIRILKKIGVD